MKMDFSVPKSNIRDKLDYFILTQKIPNLIFHGSSGTGKQTLVHEFINRIYGGDKHKLKTNTMLVNCAHGKGIKFIREDLKNFAKTNINVSSGISFKSIVLLNADHLTIDAQSALRRCIEQFSNNTRFFIVVENKNRLFNPILSRFCEIYVPDIATESSFENMHKLKIERVYPTVPSPHTATISAAIKLGYAAPNFIRDLVHTVSQLYENGASALDIAREIETSPDLTDTCKSAIIIMFYKIKSEFRNEKMIMFYILYQCAIRSDNLLQNVIDI